MALFETSAKALKKGFALTGIAVSIDRNSSVFDPVTGTNSGSSQVISAEVIFKNIESDTTKISEAIQGQQIMLGDKAVISETELVKGDRFTVNGVTWRVFGVLPKILEGKPLFYTGYIRSDG